MAGSSSYYFNDFIGRLKEINSTLKIILQIYIYISYHINLFC